MGGAQRASRDPHERCERGHGGRNILSRGLEQVGEGRSKSTPVETALPVDTGSVSTKRVVEAGSPTLKREPSGER
jgi:putative transposase